MADTGSEVAEGTTRGATGTVARILERRFLWEARGDRHDIHTHDADGDVAIAVRCPEDDFDRRAQEVIEALAHEHVRTNVIIDDERSELVVGIPREDLGKTQRALERLHASKESGFTLDDVSGLELVEEVTGRRTLGRPVTVERTGETDGSHGMAVESSTLVFANHPEEAELDAGHAEAYAKGMRELGFDADAREVTSARTGDDGAIERTRRHVVAVSYLETDREDFVLANAVTLHDVGVLEDFGAEDPYVDDERSYAQDHERLVGQAQARRERFERNQAGVEERQAPRELSLKDYEAMPVRIRAKVDPRDVPREAYGSQSVRDAAREARDAASALNAGREPSRTHPSIGERVG